MESTDTSKLGVIRRNVKTNYCFADVLDLGSFEYLIIVLLP